MARRRGISKRYLRPRWHFLSQDKKGILSIEGHSVKDLAAQYGTPLYVLVESEIRNRLRRFKTSFPYAKFRPQYACKCNSNLEIMRIVREEGFELDASSVGEIILGLLADFQPTQITFTNLYKTANDIMFAAKVGVQAITVDSLEELYRVEEVGKRIRKKIRVFLRFNLMIDYKDYTSKKQQYGIPYSYAKKAINIAKGLRHIQVIGLHFHGSYMKYHQVYSIAAKKLLKLAKYCKDQGIDIEFIDLGGGFPVEHGSKKVFTPEDMGKNFVKLLNKLIQKHELPAPTLIFEPGKFVVANSGVGLTKIISLKKLKKKKMFVVDGSTYAFLPDPLIYKCYYDILPATRMNKRRTDVFDIAGCTCDCIDIIGSKRWLPRLEENDLLAIMDCGAYSNVMASNFNTLKRAPMIMIKENGTIKQIRRRDRYSEMFAPELDVLKVADPKELKQLYNLYRVNVAKLWRGKVKKRK